MELSQQVCSYELAKRLKELGVKQSSLYFWEKCPEEEFKFVISSATFHDKIMNEWGDGHALRKQENYSAFTVAELGEMLPVFARAYNQLSIDKSHMLGWHVKYDCSRESYYSTSDDNLADAMAKMLIHLLENGLVKNDN